MKMGAQVGRPGMESRVSALDLVYVGNNSFAAKTALPVDCEIEDLHVFCNV